MTLLLSNEEIDSILDVSMVLDAVETSQRAMAASKALSSPRVDALAPTMTGEVQATYGLKSMSGLWPEAGVAALRINSDVLVWPTVAGNVRLNRLPTSTGRWTGMIILYSMTTGEPLMMSPTVTSPACALARPMAWQRVTWQRKTHASWRFSAPAGRRRPVDGPLRGAAH